MLDRTPDGLLDARGLFGPLAKISHRGEVAGPVGPLHFDVVTDRMTITECSLAGVDFSFAALPNLLVSDGVVENCKFDDALLSGMSLTRTRCCDVSFRGANLGGGGLGGFRGGSNVYERVDFRNARLGPGLPSAILRDCVFGPLEDTYFGSSEFYGCTFVGPITHVTFHGTMPLPGGKSTPGCLSGCDFSGAELKYMSFVGVDVSSCVFGDVVGREGDAGGHPRRFDGHRAGMPAGPAFS